MKIEIQTNNQDDKNPHYSSAKIEINSVACEYKLFDSFSSSEITESVRILSTPSTFAKNTLYYVQEAGKLKSLKSHISKRESLDSYLFIIVTAGSGTITYEEQVFAIEVGDLLLIDCAKSYSHQSSEDDPWELMWVHFNGTDMDQFYHYFMNKYKSIRFRTMNPSYYYEIIERLLTLSSQKSTDSELLISNLLYGMVINILTAEDIFTNNNEKICASKLIQIKNYIDENYSNKISLEDLARKFFISKYHMAREFKKTYGVTMISYVNIKRITQAKGLLRFSDRQIEEIGGACGIMDNSYFNKVFRKTEGMTASEYRKKWRGVQ